MQNVYVPTPVDTIVTGQFDQITGLITTVLLPALFGLVIIGVAIFLGIKYVKKGSRSV